MNRFAELLDALLFTPSRNGKLRLMAEYFANQPDPERGWALAALTGELAFAEAKPGQVRALAMARVDPVLFGWSLDFVGDLAETVSLIWPEPLLEPSPVSGLRPEPPSPAMRERGFIAGTYDPSPVTREREGPIAQRWEGEGGALSLSEIVATLQLASRAEVAAHLAGWLDRLDATGRWALLKLVTGALRIGVSARLAKTALAEWSGQQIEEIEEIWHGLAPPYLPLFAWLDGKAPRPEIGALPNFTPLMLAQPIDEEALSALDPAGYFAEWKWDGIRVQLVSRHGERRVYSRSGDDIGAAFPDIIAAMPEAIALDGELLVIRDGEVAPFNDLQQRLNRKTPTPKMLSDYPASVRLYDILRLGDEDLRPSALGERRHRLEAWYGNAPRDRLDLSPLVPFDSWADLKQLRDNARANGIEGLMLKRRDSRYLSGRPKGPWFKWKRGALTIDAVLMYAQRGHGKRSSFYSDYTFGAWHDAALVPVGKAYSGFTDDELRLLDKWVRDNTVKRFGPVREVAPGLVLEIAFDSVHRSTRHKSGVAMRFPRVHRIRWDKPFAEADTLENLRRLMT